MQIELLRELIKLQKDMIIMLLSMLEGKHTSSPHTPMIHAPVS